MLKRGIEIMFLVITLLQDDIFSPTLIQSIERKRKIVVIEYSIFKKIGFLDNLRKSLVRMNTVSSDVERVTQVFLSV